MTIHWQSLDRDAKIKAIRMVWSDGISARQIAAHFEGATRDAVIGMYHRWSDQLEGTPLRRERDNRSNISRARGVKPRAKSCKAVKHTIAEIFAAEPYLAGRPIRMLDRHQCRCAVNDAAVGEEHLFCGLPSEGSFCAHHHGRVYARQHTDRET